VATPSEHGNIGPLDRLLALFRFKPVSVSDRILFPFMLLGTAICCFYAIHVAGYLPALPFLADRSRVAAANYQETIHVLAFISLIEPLSLLQLCAARERAESPVSRYPELYFQMGKCFLYAFPWLLLIIGQVKIRLLQAA
jgi:hypothetical protein